MSKRAIVLSVVCAVGLVAPAPVVGDYYDCFSDGQYYHDPNDLCDIDDANWTMHELVGIGYYYGASDGWLRLYVAELFGLGFLGATVDAVGSPNCPCHCLDATTSFDDTGAHYIVAKIKLYDPNSGEVSVGLHANPLHWTVYVAGFEADDDKYAVAHVNGTDWDDGGTYQTRADLDEPNGFWMALQFDGDGDPNHSYLRSAAWNGDKFDWDGAWDIEHHIFTSWDPNEPGLSYWSSGLCGVAVVVSQWSTPTGFSDAKFDGIEVRWGTFTNVFRTLTLKKKDCTIVLEPNLPDPAGGDLRRYTNGTVLCLQAEPVGNKTFNKWVIKGPNQVGDPAYQEINDTNIVLCLTMDGDYWVKGVCKCGGGGVEPFAAVVLLTLGLGVLLRRIR